MAGLKDKRGFIDKDRLDLSERQAVEHWMKRWGVTRDQLTAAHRKAGRMVKDIAAEEKRGAAQRNDHAKAGKAGQDQAEPAGIFDGKAAA